MGRVDYHRTTAKFSQSLHEIKSTRTKFRPLIKLLLESGGGGGDELRSIENSAPLDLFGTPFLSLLEILMAHRSSTQGSKGS